MMTMGSMKEIVTKKKFMTQVQPHVDLNSEILVKNVPRIILMRKAYLMQTISHSRVIEKNVQNQQNQSEMDASET